VCLRGCWWLEEGEEGSAEEDLCLGERQERDPAAAQVMLHIMGLWKVPPLFGSLLPVTRGFRSFVDQTFFQLL
jgi:hypothetical protein